MLAKRISAARRERSNNARSEGKRQEGSEHLPLNKTWLRLAGDRPRRFPPQAFPSGQQVRAGGRTTVASVDEPRAERGEAVARRRAVGGTNAIPHLDAGEGIGSEGRRAGEPDQV